MRTLPGADELLAVEHGLDAGEHGRDLAVKPDIRALIEPAIVMYPWTVAAEASPGAGVWVFA